MYLFGVYPIPIVVYILDFPWEDINSYVVKLSANH